jgi:polyisoprenoid-binding protein YceI
MRQNLSPFFMALTLFYLSILPVKSAEKWMLDPNHTYVLWHIQHYGFSIQSGKWYASGNLELDEENPQNSKVNAVIQVKNIITGLPELDKHLKGKLFSDVSTFPIATFTSDKVTLTNKKTAHVHGMLTIHGITKPVTLDVQLNKMGVSLITNKMTAGFSAHTKIKRSDFGINTLLPGLGDEVDITIEAEALQNGTSALTN